ncbi:hypothetical protein KIN20_024546 [Parelaphostrongylus tenuis]|uniref:Uncharacterized protein n=1 Tax=Parelaphostrongylus tenuis TaxID=148309 RepID=A0AAD5N7P9_PARTN|nr:hypothetical protein KIN20_024546 [Parelaphostrongylus tenuis]
MMMAATQKGEDSMHLSAISSSGRFRRGGTYSAGGAVAGRYGGGNSGQTSEGSECQCAEQASNCPAGPLGL